MSNAVNDGAKVEVKRGDLIKFTDVVTMQETTGAVVDIFPRPDGLNNYGVLSGNQHVIVADEHVTERC